MPARLLGTTLESLKKAGDIELYQARLAGEVFLVVREEVPCRSVSGLEGSLARAAEHFQRLPERSRSAPKLAWLEGPPFGIRSIERLRWFQQSSAGRLPPWVLVHHGSLVGAGEGVPAELLSGQPEVQAEPRASRIHGHPDTELAVLKAVLLPARSKKPVEQEGAVAALAQRAGVSLPQTYRILARLEDQGFLVREKQGPRLQRHRVLLESWAKAAIRPWREALGVRARQRKSSPELWLQATLRQLTRQGKDDVPPLVLGLHEAAARWRAREVLGARPSFYALAPVEEIFVEFDWERVGPAEAEAFLAPCPWPLAVARFAVWEYFPRTDLLQTWLDLRFHPQRGEEAAAALWPRLVREFRIPEERKL